MKRILACTVAAILAASMMTACGDTADTGSENGGTTTAPATTTAAEETATTTAAEETPSEGEESAAEGDASAAEGDASAAEGGSAEGEGQDTSGNFQPISSIKDSLKNYDGASLTFAADTDVTQFAEIFDQEVSGKKPSDLDKTYEGDEAFVDFSVQDVGGVPMMKMEQVLFADPDDRGKYTIQNVKVRFDMKKLFAGHEDELKNIFTIKADLVAIGRNQQEYDTGLMSPVCVPWYGGAFGTDNMDEDGTDHWNGNLIEYSMSSLASAEGDTVPWSNQWAYTEAKIRPGLKEDAILSADYAESYVTLMAWKVTSRMDFYIADLVFEDADGNVIPVPEENIPGGASYTQEDNSDILADGKVTYDDAGNAVYDGVELPDYQTAENYTPAKQ